MKMEDNMDFFLSSIVMGCNLLLALIVFGCLSQPERYIHRGKKMGILHSENREHQLQEMHTIGHILLILLFFFSLVCGVVLAIIQNTFP